MTNRERWIVYPLLFLALGTSLRDKFTRGPAEIEAQVVHCKTLTVEDAVQCRRVLVVGQDDTPGAVLATVPMRRSDGRVGTCGVLTLQGIDGRPIAEIGATRDGQAGVIAAFDLGKSLAIEMGHFNQGAGIVADNLRGTQVPLTQIISIDQSPGPPQTGMPPEPAE